MARDILILAKAYPPIPGGVETYSEAVVKAYLKLGYSIHLLTQTSGPTGWNERQYNEGIIKIFNVGPGRQAKVFLAFTKQLLHLLRHKRFEFCHSTTWRPGLALMPWFRKMPFVVTVHGREVMNYPIYLKHPMIKTLQSANVVVTVSQATYAVAEAALDARAPKGQWASLFNGITYPEAARSFQRQFQDPNLPIRLLSLARHVPRKNIQGCLKALGYLHRNEHLDFQYTIGGRGPMFETLRQICQDEGIADKVNFIGYVEEKDIPDLYKTHDVFLHPQTNVGEGNDFEGFGLVIADAMSFGCAVLAGEAGGPKDFIRSGENGLLVNGLNQDDIIFQMRRLIKDHTFRSRLGSSASLFAQNELSWDKHIAGIIQMLGEHPQE